MLKLCLLLFLAIQYRNLVISRISGWSPFLYLKVGSKVWSHYGVWFQSLPGTQLYLDLIRVCETMKYFITKIQEVSGTSLLPKRFDHGGLFGISSVLIMKAHNDKFLRVYVKCNESLYSLVVTILRPQATVLFIMELQICLSIRISSFLIVNRLLVNPNYYDNRWRKKLSGEDVCKMMTTAFLTVLTW